MPQSLSSILVHIVFSTKNRESLITPALESELHPYMATIFREHNSPSLAIDGTTDHVHILIALGRTVAVADLVEEVKTGSSKWIKTKGREFRDFHWQKGYGAFSIGQSNVAALKGYIRNQKEHHRRVRFQDEYRDFLKRYELNLMNDMCGIDHFAPSALGPTSHLILGLWPGLSHFAPLALAKAGG